MVGNNVSLHTIWLPYYLNYCIYITFLKVVCFCENIKSHFTWFNLLITIYDLIVVTELVQAKMENIAKGDYVDLLINDQVIGLGRVEST